MKFNSIIKELYNVLLKYRCTSEEMAVILLKLSDMYKRYLVKKRLKKIKEMRDFMQPYVILLCMIFCHIVDDYYLQGLLAKLKQKSYWEHNAPDEMYKHDYLMALLMHSMSWAFMIMLPLLIYFNFEPPNSFLILWLANTAIHFVVDDLKANRRKINLIQDQTTHLLQIIITLVIMY